jgi:hypothetical protein
VTGTVSIEFNETWQRPDGATTPSIPTIRSRDNVELMNVRVRNLKRACADAAP